MKKYIVFALIIVLAATAAVFFMNRAEEPAADKKESLQPPERNFARKETSGLVYWMALPPEIDLNIDAGEGRGSAPGRPPRCRGGR